MKQRVQKTTEINTEVNCRYVKDERNTRVVC